MLGCLGLWFVIEMDITDVFPQMIFIRTINKDKELSHLNDPFFEVTVT